MELRSSGLRAAFLPSGSTRRAGNWRDHGARRAGRSTSSPVLNLKVFALCTGARGRVNPRIELQSGDRSPIIPFHMSVDRRQKRYL